MISLLLLTVFMAKEICGAEGQAVGSGDEVSPSSSRGTDLLRNPSCDRATGYTGCDIYFAIIGRVGMGATEDSLDSSSHKGNSLVDVIKSSRSRTGANCRTRAGMRISERGLGNTTKRGYLCTALRSLW